MDSGRGRALVAEEVVARFYVEPTLSARRGFVDGDERVATAKADGDADEYVRVVEGVKGGEETGVRHATRENDWRSGEWVFWRGGHGRAFGG